MRMSMVATSTKFQSTLPRGERPASYISMHLLTQFQSTLPRGERLEVDERIWLLSEFQSTLPRGERHDWGTVITV